MNFLYEKEDKAFFSPRPAILGRDFLATRPALFSYNLHPSSVSFLGHSFSCLAVVTLREPCADKVLDKSFAIPTPQILVYYLRPRESIVRSSRIFSSEDT